jgi:hypothetical protein
MDQTVREFFDFMCENMGLSPWQVCNQLNTRARTMQDLPSSQLPP